MMLKTDETQHQQPQFEFNRKKTNLTSQNVTYIDKIVSSEILQIKRNVIAN